MPISQPSFVAFFDHIAYRTDDIKVQAKMLIARKGFAADLNQYALIFLCFHVSTLLILFLFTILPYFREFCNDLYSVI